MSRANYPLFLFQAFTTGSGEESNVVYSSTRGQLSETAANVFIILLDVLTPLSDCRQESVEKMERRIWGVSYLYWICTTGFCVVGFCVLALFRLPRRGLPRPTDTLRLPRRGLSRPYRYIQANRLPRLQGYHTRATTLHTNFWVQAGYHTCG